MVKYLHIILFVLTCRFSFSQEPRHYNFTHYTVESGLISYQVNSCVQDPEGYTWIGTNDGLQRFDGIRYRDFRHKDGDGLSLPFKGVKQILFDADKNMWLLSTDGQAGRFDTKTFRYAPAVIRTRNELALQSILNYKRLIKDLDGNIFLLLPGRELLTYETKRNEFSAANNFFKIKSDWLITDFLQQPGTKKYWMCLKDSGIAVYNAASGNMSCRYQNTEGENVFRHLDTVAPYRLFFDTRNRLWFAAGEERPWISCYDLNKDQFELKRFDFYNQLKSHYDIYDFLEQQDGSIWVTGIKVLAKYLARQKQFEQVFNGFVDDRSIDYILITQMNEDREHNLWIGTGNNGLYRFNPAEEFFSNIKRVNKATGDESDASPIAFAADNDGSIITAVWGEGLVRYTKNLQEVPLGIKGFQGNESRQVSEMCSSNDGNYVWMAVQGGLYKYGKLSRSVEYFNLPEIRSRIRVMREDAAGNLWIGTQETGVYKLPAANNVSKGAGQLKKVDAIPSTKINKIAVDSKGHVWIGTFGHGAYVLDAVTENPLMHFSKKATGALQLPEITVSSLFAFDDSTMIIATPSSLLLYNQVRNTTSNLGSSQSIFGYISSLERDRFGFLWVSTTSALYRVAVQRKLFVMFNRLDGIRSDFFVVNASGAMPDGHLIFGATGTMVVFDPKDVKIKKTFPEVHITDFKVMNQSLRIDSLLQQPVIKLAADENSITVDVSTLSYNNPFVIRYKMEGLDEDWKKADRSGELIYSYLPPGNYRLLLNVINADGIAEKKITQLNIIIQPPFWKTWWFLGLLVLAVTGILFWIDKERMKRREAVQQMRTNIAANLHQDINTALGNINVLSEMARIKIEKDHEKSKEFIEQIHSKSGQMIYKMEDMLWAIAPGNDSMQKTVERMREFIDGLQATYESEIKMIVEERVVSLKVDMQWRHEVFILFKESIGALQQAGAANCIIQASLTKNNLAFAVQFAALNCDVKQLHGFFQSSEMQQKLDRLGAYAELNAAAVDATLFITVPL